jgi:hypothetical protein
MPRRTLFAIFAVLFFSLAACTSKPVQTVENTAPSGTTPTEQDMRRAILLALERRHWSVQSAEAGRILAQITVRQEHHAEIAIPYSASRYAIQYRDSQGLDYRKGKIHRNYNNWVLNLDRTIQQELTSPSRYLTP